MRLHYLQHVPFENPGSILDWAAQQGHAVTRTLLCENESLPPPDAFDWLIVMGGPMNIYQEEEYPWLKSEKAFLRRTIDSGKIVLGFCLGGQLIADVLGGRVTKNPVSEVGWFSVRLSEAAGRHPLFSFFPPEPVVFEWHGDTFSQLPEEAVLLAGNDACAHQAFAYRDRVFGFQFHLEDTREIIQALITHCPEDLSPGPCVQSAAELLAHPEHIERTNQWMAHFLTGLEQRERAAAHPLRYKARICSDGEKINGFLAGARVGTVSFSAGDYPYATPVNYVWHGGSIYFHGMGSGKKFELLSAAPQVCFTVYEEYGTVTDPVPCHADTSYFSVMLFGQARPVTDSAEAAGAMQALVQKFMPGYYRQPIQRKLIENYRSSMDRNPVAVYRITPAVLTAKENSAPAEALYSAPGDFETIGR